MGEAGGGAPRMAHIVSDHRLPIETRSLLLRQFAPGDAGRLLLLSQEDGARTWLPSQVYRDGAHADSALAFLMSQYSTPGDPRRGPYVLGIEHRASSSLIGHVGFSPLDEDVEIGFSIAQSYQGQGFASEAIVAASRWALRVFGIRRILAIASTANVASRRTLARAGFVHEGDKTMNFQGTVEEVSVYALPGDSGHDDSART